MLKSISLHIFIVVVSGISSLFLTHTVYADVKKFNASIWLPDSVPLVKNGYLEWAEDIERVSNGKLKAKVFTGSVLLPPASHMSGLSDGVADVAYHAGTYTPAEIPRDNILAQLAFNYSDYFVAVFAITDMNMFDSEMVAQWDDKNIVFGGGFATIPYRLFCSTKVTTLAELKGKRVRMPGSVHSDWAKSVGAVPVNVPSTEMYSGLDKGQLDCASNTMDQLRASSLWEVAKHTTMVDLGIYYAGYEYGVNKDFWNTLSGDERRIFLDTFATAMVKTGIGYMASSDEVINEAPEHGITFHEPAQELKNNIDAFKSSARTSAVKLGVEKFGIANAEDIISRFEAKVAKWEDLLKGVDRNDEKALVALVKTEIYDKIDVMEYGVKN